MAMPSSGCIGLKCCIDGIPCSSIANAVYGSIPSTVSLCVVSEDAGKTAPHAMSEFYGYSPISYKQVNFSNIYCCTSNPTQVCSLDAIVTSPSMSAGECYNLTLFWSLSTGPAKMENAAVYLYCNSSIKCGCSIGIANLYCYGCWNVNIKYGEGWCLCLCASAGYIGGTAEAEGDISSVSGVVGYFCEGSITYRGIIACNGA